MHGFYYGFQALIVVVLQLINPLPSLHSMGGSVSVFKIILGSKKIIITSLPLKSTLVLTSSKRMSVDNY